MRDNQASGPVRHVVYFWLKDPRSADDRERIIAGLRKLAAIEVVQSLHIGVPAPTVERDVVDQSWSVSEAMTFASPADEALYQQHPLHRAFVAECGALWDRVQVYDSIDVA